jgi:hypothetical protein
MGEITHTFLGWDSRVHDRLWDRHLISVLSVYHHDKNVARRSEYGVLAEVSVGHVWSTELDSFGLWQPPPCLF